MPLVGGSYTLTVAVTADRVPAPAVAAAAASVTPVVRTSSTNTVPWGVSPTRAKTGAVLWFAPLPACLLASNAGRRHSTTGMPVSDESRRASTTPGSIPYLTTRHGVRGMGTSDLASAGIRCAMASTARNHPAASMPSYLSRCTNVRAAPSWTKPLRTIPKDSKRSGPARRPARHAGHTVTGLNRRHDRQTMPRIVTGRYDRNELGERCGPLLAVGCWPRAKGQGPRAKGQGPMANGQDPRANGRQAVPSCQPER